MMAKGSHVHPFPLHFMLRLYLCIDSSLHTCHSLAKLTADLQKKCPPALQVENDGSQRWMLLLLLLHWANTQIGSGWKRGIEKGNGKQDVRLMFIVEQSERGENGCSICEWATSRKWIMGGLGNCSWENEEIASSVLFFADIWHLIDRTYLIAIQLFDFKTHRIQTPPRSKHRSRPPPKASKCGA